jgi:murein DD-endopeptidase MepM/ murein hydrolase activator NlpD
MRWIALVVLIAIPASADPTVVDISTRVPARWLTNDFDTLPLEPPRQRARMPRQCRTRGGYRRFCQGARIVPTPIGPDAALAERLGLGLRATAMQIMFQPPFEEWLDAVGQRDSQEELTFPVPSGHLGRGFGHTRTGELRFRQHRGIDIGAEEGAAIVAARGGLVVYSDNELTGYGNVVIVLHEDGASTFYAHCHSTFVFAGQHVTRGQLIAVVGHTGFAGGPHLHFEYRQRGWPRNPVSLFLPR